MAVIARVKTALKNAGYEKISLQDALQKRMDKIDAEKKRIKALKGCMR